MQLTYKELDELGEGLAKKLLTGTKETVVSSIDIDALVKDYLKTNIRYESFAERDKGKIGFLSNGKDGLSIYKNNIVERVIFPKDTIVIERYLLSPAENSRRRFTLAHEAAHIILETLGKKSKKAPFHNEFDAEMKYTKEEIRELLSMTESYANRLAAAILMPKFLLETTFDVYNKGKRIKCYGKCFLPQDEKDKIEKISTALGVSKTALTHRLYELKMFDFYPMEEFLSETFNI